MVLHNNDMTYSSAAIEEAISSSLRHLGYPRLSALDIDIYVICFVALHKHNSD